MSSEQQQEIQRLKNEVFGAQKKSEMPSYQAQGDELDFEMPIETVPLPSKGLVYPPTSKLHMKTSVDVRSMTVKDQDIFTSRAYAKKGTTTSKLLESCITEKGIDVREMISSDRMAILISLRIISQGADYSFSTTCEECDFVNDDCEINLGKLPIKTLEIQPYSLGSNLFEIQLPVSKKIALIKFITGKDEEEINTIQEKRKKMGMENDELVSTRLKYSIVSVNGVSDRSKIGKFIESMPTRDSAEITKFFKEHEPGIEMKTTITCKNCDAEKEIDVPLNANFFRPS